MLKIFKYIKKTKGIRIPKKTYYQSKREIGNNISIIRFRFQR